jgi:hypothetical protein
MAEPARRWDVSRVALHVPLPAHVRTRAAADTARRGLGLQTWAAETLEAHLAGCACAHGARVVEPVAPPERVED